MKITTVVGTRPNFVKVGPLSKELRKYFKEVIVNTDQHYDRELSKVFFKQLKIPEPDYNLNVGSESHAEQTGQIIMRLEKALLKEKPNMVLVFGDTNSTLGGALCASKLRIPVIHIESGMRSYDKIPEEINRIVVDHISDIFFCSNRLAVGNLKKEGINKNVFLVGDLMVDALIQNIKIAEKNSNILEKLTLKKKSYILATIHRAENTDDKRKLISIIDALFASDERIILPLHPRTKKYLERYSLIDRFFNSNITIIKPVDYLDMIVLEKNATKIVTDSGGVQKEAYFFQVPCITLRGVTEWKETVDDVYNKLVGTNTKDIVKSIKNFEIKKKSHHSYGNGDAAKKIVKILLKLKANYLKNGM